MNIKSLMSLLGIFILSSLAIIGFAQNKKGPSVSPPRLPMNIPPPPNFASMGSKTGKYQIISAEYYSQDEKAHICINAWLSLIPLLAKDGYLFPHSLLMERKGSGFL